MAYVVAYITILLTAISLVALFWYSIKLEPRRRATRRAISLAMATGNVNELVRLMRSDGKYLTDQQALVVLESIYSTWRERSEKSHEHLAN